MKWTIINHYRKHKI